MANLPSNPAASMNWAAKTLNELAERVDEGENLNEVFLSLFAETKGDLAHNTDRAVAFREIVTGMIAHAKEAKKAWDARRKLLENTLATFDGEIKATISEAPSLPFQGALGSIKLAKNPPKVSYNCLLESKSVSNVLTDDVIKMFEINPEYVIEKIYKCLDTTNVKAALQSGETLAFAELIQEQRLAVKRA